MAPPYRIRHPQVRRLLFHQLPLRRAVWGGLNLADLVVGGVALSLALFVAVFSIQSQYAANVSQGEQQREVSNLRSLGVGFAKSLGTFRILLFYPVSRSNFLTLIFGADNHQLVKYHKLFAVLIVWLSWLHAGTFYVIGFCQGNFLQTAFNFQRYDYSTVFGSLALIVTTTLYFASKPWVREHYFWVFKYVHMAGAFLLPCFLVMHENGVPGFMLPGLILYIFDLLLRGIQLVNTVMLIPGEEITVCRGSIITVSLRWQPGSALVPGQTVYLRFPSVSFESHPFTIAGVEQVSGCQGFVRTLCHIRAGNVEGSMTNALKTKLLRMQQQRLRGGHDRIRVQVEGPYWTSPGIPDDDIVVMVIGGMGITAALGLLRSWAAAAGNGNPGGGPSSSSARRRRPRAVRLLWASRSCEVLQLMDGALIDEAW